MFVDEPHLSNTKSFWRLQRAATAFSIVVLPRSHCPQASKSKAVHHQPINFALHALVTTKTIVTWLNTLALGLRWEVIRLKKLLTSWQQWICRCHWKIRLNKENWSCFIRDGSLSKPLCFYCLRSENDCYRLYDEKRLNRFKFQSHSIYQYPRCFANNTLRSGSVTCFKALQELYEQIIKMRLYSRRRGQCTSHYDIGLLFPKKNKHNTSVSNSNSMTESGWIKTFFWYVFTEFGEFRKSNEQKRNNVNWSYWESRIL